MTNENFQPELLKKAINCWESLREPMVDSGIVDPNGIIPHIVIDAFFSGYRDGACAGHDHKIQAAIQENEMGKITIECDAGKVSDGYHTFDELYAHRCHLFVALMRSNPAISWRANNHEDGTMFDGWFVAGMHLPTGDISYHLPVSMWTLLDGKGIATTNQGPKWDGHTAADTVKRLAEWCVAGHDHQTQVTRIYGARGTDVFAEGMLSTNGDLIKIEGSRDMELTPDEAARIGKELIDWHGLADGSTRMNLPIGALLMHWLNEELEIAAIEDVQAELKRAATKFPTWPTDPIHALAVLGEEYGELTKAILQHTYEPHKSTLDDVRNEAVQTAAMAIRLLMSLEVYEYRKCNQHSQ